jgi:hypothetical protein
MPASPTAPAPEKSLDAKLARIIADPSCQDFILADAKDPDMAFGLAAPGLKAGGDPKHGPYRTLAEFHDAIREIVGESLVDIMLMSASTSEKLAIDEGIFRNSPVTPAVRMNDTSDIWLASGSGGYAKEPALPFATTTIHQARSGHVAGCEPAGPYAVDLGLFSVTLNDDAVLDRAMLEAYRGFRIEAEQEGFRHFLEVFFPNALGRVPGKDPAARPANIARFLADHVVRMLAGVPKAGRPVFLKIPYLGPEVTEMLAAYDPSVVVGILGGGAGTTHDAFGLVADAKAHGARVALFGRKINAAEHQPSFVRLLREVADGNLAADEGVRAYHGELAKRGLTPHRSLENDLARSDTASAYGG